MARTYAVSNLAISKTILEGLEAKKREEGRLGSLTAYAAEILSRYISGSLVGVERAKIEADLRVQILQEMQGQPASKQPEIEVKAHRPAKEKHGLGRKTAS